MSEVKEAVPAYAYQRKYTYADLARFEEHERYEIIDGHLIKMDAPGWVHQRVVMKLIDQLYRKVEGKGCNLVAAPLDVRLPLGLKEAGREWQDNEIFNVVQPDLVIVCDKRKIDRRGIIGAPEMAVEVLSPSTKDKDISDKLLLYMNAGVQEYWIIDPEAQTVKVYLLDERGHYVQGLVYSAEDTIELMVLPGVAVELAEVFAE